MALHFSWLGCPEVSSSVELPTSYLLAVSRTYALHFPHWVSVQSSLQTEGKRESPRRVRVGLAVACTPHTLGLPLIAR